MIIAFLSNTILSVYIHILMISKFMQHHIIFHRFLYIRFTFSTCLTQLTFRHLVSIIRLRNTQIAERISPTIFTFLSRYSFYIQNRYCFFFIYPAVNISNIRCYGVFPNSLARIKFPLLLQKVSLHPVYTVLPCVLYMVMILDCNVQTRLSFFLHLSKHPS